MSGAADFSQIRAASMRALMPLTFQVAIFMGLHLTQSLASCPVLCRASTNFHADRPRKT
jgi:hypothetical protein